MGSNSWHLYSWTLYKSGHRTRDLLILEHYIHNDPTGSDQYLSPSQEQTHTTCKWNTEYHGQHMMVKTPPHTTFNHKNLRDVFNFCLDWIWVPCNTRRSHTRLLILNSHYIISYNDVNNFEQGKKNSELYTRIHIQKSTDSVLL